MGPLSAKQHREYLKFASQEARETAKMEREEARKQQLHEIKLVEAAGKAGQTLGHKEDVHKYKMGTLGAPLKVKSPNPLAGTELFKRGQHMLPYQAEDAAKARKAAKQNTDTVPAMLTPGEAVIPEPAAQDPKNKPIIKRMVQEGRKANKTKKGFLEFRDGSINIVNSDVIPSRVQQAAGYKDGTKKVKGKGLAPDGLRYQNDDPTQSSISYEMPMPKGKGYMGEIPVYNQEISIRPSAMTEYSLDDNKGQYPSLVPTLSNKEVQLITQGQMNDAIANKAAAYRDMRVNAGQSPFADRLGVKIPVGYTDTLYADGTSAVPQLMNYNEGTIQVPVPSLAYEHSDVPGSSFEDGTERVYDFNRGSSASYHYEDGVEDVPMLEPTVIAGPVIDYQKVIPENLVRVSTIKDKIENKIEDAVPRSVYPDVTADMKLKDVQAKINGSVSSEFDIPERPFKNVGMEVIEPLPMLAAKPKVVVEGKDRFPVPSPVVAKSVGGNNSTIDMPAEPVAFIPDPDAKQASNAEMQALIDVNEGKIVPPLKPEDDDTRPEYWIKQLRGSQKDVDKAIANKDDESAINSLKDLFTYKGIKSVLGLNDQEVARLAVATVAGRAMGYDTARALSYGGRQAFETSLRRQAQEEANKRQDKQLAAQTEREDMRTAITLAGQAKSDKKAEADRKLAEKRLSLQERKEEAIQAAREADRRFEILKEDNRWSHTQSKDARAEQQHLNDQLLLYISKDIPPAVRSKGLGMAFAEAKTPEDWMNNMRNATTYLAANVQHYPPGYGRRGGSGSGDDDGEGGSSGKNKKYKPNWQSYVTPEGNTITASRRPDGHLDVATPQGVVAVPSNYAVNYNEKKDNENNVRTIVENRVKAIKGINEGQVGKMKEDAVLMSQQFQHINPVQFSHALEKTFSNLKEKGEGLSSDAFKHAFTTTAIVEMNPSSSHLYSGTDKEGKSGYLSDRAQVDMGKAMEQLSRTHKGKLDVADKDMKTKWNSLTPEQRETMLRIGSNGKGQDVGKRREGYSAYSEFVIQMAKPPENRDYPWLKTIK